MTDPFVLPRLFISTTDTELNIGGILEGENRFAANNDPPTTTTPVDVRVQLHESMVSNLIAPVIQNRLIQSWQIRTLAQLLAADGGANLPEDDDERRWGLRFEDGRPIQIEFEGNELGVRIYGKSFIQGRDRYRDPINIFLRLRVINDEGKLKLLRIGVPTVEFTFDPAEGKKRSAKSIAFRQFLADSLETALKGDPMEGAIELPENLIPLDSIENEELKEQLKNVKLVELSAENGWLNLGWNYVDGDYTSWSSNTPAIWAAPAPEDKEEDDEGDEDSELESPEGESDSPSVDG